MMNKATKHAEDELVLTVEFKTLFKFAYDKQKEIEELKTALEEASETTIVLMKGFTDYLKASMSQIELDAVVEEFKKLISKPGSVRM